jgi:hypothetical protein
VSRAARSRRKAAPAALRLDYMQAWSDDRKASVADEPGDEHTVLAWLAFCNSMHQIACARRETRQGVAREHSKALQAWFRLLSTGPTCELMDAMMLASMALSEQANPSDVAGALSVAARTFADSMRARGYLRLCDAVLANAGAAAMMLASQPSELSES